jgi:hypothetical protein
LAYAASRFPAGERLVSNTPGAFSAGIIFQTPALSLPQFEPQLQHNKKNRSWEDGADDSDDMVVWASYAFQSLMAAALADDRHRDIKSQWCS